MKKFFKRIGIDFKTIGGEIDFYGQQQPIAFNIKDVLNYMLENNPSCWDIVSDGGRLQARANKLKESAFVSLSDEHQQEELGSLEIA